MLWKLHNKNGGLMSYNEWTFFTGGVLRLDFTKDIPIADNSAPGLSTNKNINITMQITNINSTRTVNYVAWIIFVYKGILAIDTVDGTANAYTTTLTKEDVLAVGFDVDNAEVSSKSHGWLDQD